MTSGFKLINRAVITRGDLDAALDSGGEHERVAAGHVNEQLRRQGSASTHYNRHDLRLDVGLADVTDFQDVASNSVSRGLAIVVALVGCAQTMTINTDANGIAILRYRFKHVAAPPP